MFGKKIIFILKFIAFSSIIFILSGCSLPQPDEEDVFAVLDIRAIAINNKSPKDMNYVLSAEYPEREKVMQNFMMNATYFERMNYELVERKILSYSPISKKVSVEQIYNLSFKMPDKPLKELKNKKELIVLQKGEKNWKVIEGIK